MKKRRAATRGSKLALAQTHLAAEALRKAHPGLVIAIQPVQTAGDQQGDVPLWKLEGVGFFTSRLEQELLAGRADFAVHSLKDLPAEMPEGLVIGAVLQRFYPEDVMVCRRPVRGLEEVANGARVGTSSVRRTAQLLHLRPDLVIEPIRGNVETRLNKLADGDYDAVVLARAGLERLGNRHWQGFCFDVWEFLPAPGQGAIAIQARSDDPEMIDLLGSVHHERTGLEAGAERRVLARLHPGCHGPVGAYAEIKEGKIRIAAFVADPSGHPFLREEICGRADNALQCADQVADALLSKGARKFLENHG